MSKTRFALGALALALLPFTAHAQAPSPEWTFNATIIEACSCPMFCQCYFNPAPSGEHGKESGHFCRFNNAFKINKGKYGNTSLDGAKFWVYGDLGGDFSKGHMDWAVVTFDKSLTKEQREGIGAILAHVYPVQWGSLTTQEGAMEWTLGDKESWATLDGGKTAEVRLSSAALQRNEGVKPTVINNLKYWGVPRNDGFVLMPNTVEAVRKGEKSFEFSGTNGFLITIDMNSSDVAKKG